MKMLRKMAWLSVFLLAPFAQQVLAQCNGTLQSVAYDTLIPGTGNSIFQIRLPTFDPTIGTLVSAKLNSAISVNYGFTLKNVEDVQRDFSVTVGRYDHYTSSALSSPYTNLLDTAIGNFILNPGDSVTRSPYTILYRYNLSDSITDNMADFLGDTAIAFNYTPITYTNLTGSNTYYYSATASDTVHFTLTYFYCSSSILADNILSFLATNQYDGSVRLAWSITDPEQTVSYDVEGSTDGKQFFPIALMNGIASENAYAYVYRPAAGQEGQFYFRLKITYQSGAQQYSVVRSVDLGDGDPSTPPFLYPNPSHDFINLVLANGDWDIDVYASSGQLIQRNQVSHTSTWRIDFRDHLAAGVYFVKAERLTTHQVYKLSFVCE